MVQGEAYGLMVTERNERVKFCKRWGGVEGASFTQYFIGRRGGVEKGGGSFCCDWGDEDRREEKEMEERELDTVQFVTGFF